MGGAGRHPNITILTNTEVESIDGEEGCFTVTAVRHPRYVHEELCTGCGTCTLHCPYTRANPFDEGLGRTKAISKWSPQSMPDASYIDRATCLYFQHKCKICARVCKSQAIDFAQKKRRVRFRVGAVILSAGYRTFAADRMREYGHGRLKNVLTSLELERCLNASGPYRGAVLRPSDGQPPRRVAWLQCVGSRDLRFDRSYCSATCCTSAVKQLMLLKRHHPHSEATIFHNDIRTYGKGSEELYESARRLPGVRFVRARVPDVHESAGDRNVVVRYVADDGKVREETFDLLTLSVGAEPSESTWHLANTARIELDPHGFCRTNPFAPNETCRPGILAAGTFSGPMDIPDAISSAAGAAGVAAQLLAAQRGTLSREKACPPEKAVDGEEPRIGVFVCRCGTNVAGVADVPSLVRHSRTLRGVVFVADQLISCGASECRDMTKAIADHRLNRVVVAACSPRDREVIFREALREAGLNPYLLAMANIREHCTWVHAGDKQQATQKAKDLIGMAVARARVLAPLYEIRSPVTKSALVLGGGAAGMTAALGVAEQGFQVYLVEKKPQLGGHLRSVHYTFEGQPTQPYRIQPYLASLIGRVQTHPRVEVLLGHEVTGFSGSVGKFRTTVRAQIGSDAAERRLEHGIAILATGARELIPKSFRYGESPRILTQSELEPLIADDALPDGLAAVAMIQCVEARDSERPYCGRVCCADAIKNALLLKSRNPALAVVIFYRDIRTYGLAEDSYRRAREEGVLFVPYDPDRPPRIDLDGGKIVVTFRHPLLAVDSRLHADLLVLSTPPVPDGNADVARTLRLPLTADGFFAEAHVKLRPLDFATEGIFLCGAAQYPRPLAETLSQANGAALRAATILAGDAVFSGGVRAEIAADQCNGCARCVPVCPYGAIEMNPSTAHDVAVLNPALCKGCGPCASVCPTPAVKVMHFTDEQILAEIDASFAVPQSDDLPRILAFLCHWCGYGAADLAGTLRLQYPVNVRAIRLMCSGRLDRKFIYEAFLHGADAVLIVGCREVDCHYISGVQQTKRLIPLLQRHLENLGISRQRLRLELMSSAEGAKYANTVRDFVAAVAAAGRLRLGEERAVKLRRLRDKSAKRRDGTTPRADATDATYDG